MDKLFTYTANIEGRWYAFGFVPERKKVCSIGTDNPRVQYGTGRYYSSVSPEGVKSISSPSVCQSGAINKAKRGGIYNGIFNFLNMISR